jgi:hypothetical protein
MIKTPPVPADLEPHKKRNYPDLELQADDIARIKRQLGYSDQAFVPTPRLLNELADLASATLNRGGMTQAHAPADAANKIGLPESTPPTKVIQQCESLVESARLKTLVRIAGRTLPTAWQPTYSANAPRSWTHSGYRVFDELDDKRAIALRQAAGVRADDKVSNGELVYDVVQRLRTRRPIQGVVTTILEDIGDVLREVLLISTKPDELVDKLLNVYRQAGSPQLH